MAKLNRQIRLISRPIGLPKQSDFEMIEGPLAEPSDGEALTRTLLLSLDPYMRGRLNDTKSYAAPVPIGGVMVGQTVGGIGTSRDSALVAGGLVVGPGHWQECAGVRAKTIRQVAPGVAP